MEETTGSSNNLIVLVIVVLFLNGSIAFPIVTSEEAEIAETSTTAEFPYPGDDWAWSMIGSEYAHRINETGDGVRIAVLDTGIDYNHLDLEDKMWEDLGYDFVNNDDDPMDEDGHGTHVAGIVSSVAPRAELMALKVIEEQGGNWIDLANAIDYARNHGADIITMSLGAQKTTLAPLVEMRINAAYNDGILLAGAAGNADDNETFYPAGYDSVISVSAVNSTKQKAFYSNYGDWIELAAPGGGREKQIYSTLLDGSYGNMIGTSMACPFVTGAAALRLGAKPNETIEDVRTVMQETAIDLGNEEYYGHGLVNAYRAAGGEVPTSVQNLEAEPDDSIVNLSWEKPWHEGTSPVDGFRIYRGEYEGEMVMIDDVGPDQHYYEDIGVKNEVTYQYTVTAYNENGEGLESEMVFATPRDEPVVPSQPREASAELLEDGVELTWKEPIDDGGSNITGYNIYRTTSESEDMEWLAKADKNTIRYLDERVSPEKEYIYGLTAENEIGESERSLTDSIIIPGDYEPPLMEPSSPRNVSAELMDEGVEVRWEEPIDDGGSSIIDYNIYRKEDESEFELIGESDNRTFRYIDDIISSGSEYTYGVTAENEVGESDRSSSSAVSVPEDYSTNSQEDEKILDWIDEIDVTVLTAIIIGTGLLIIVAILLGRRKAS